VGLGVGPRYVIDIANMGLGVGPRYVIDIANKMPRKRL